MKTLETIETFDQLLNEKKDFVIYKHSSICPVSTAAKEQVLEFLKDDKETMPFYEVLVIESRPISNKIAEKTLIRHQSPQILVFRQGECTANFSHNKITVEKLKESLA